MFVIICNYPLHWICGLYYKSFTIVIYVMILALARIITYETFKVQFKGHTVVLLKPDLDVQQTGLC
jgi:hypothetical protein